MISVFIGNISSLTPPLQRVSLELVVADYDRIGSSDPIGRVECGYNRKGTNNIGLKLVFGNVN